MMQMVPVQGQNAQQMNPMQYVNPAATGNPGSTYMYVQGPQGQPQGNGGHVPVMQRGAGGNGPPGRTCWAWEKSGQCKYGSGCKFPHPGALDADTAQPQGSSTRAKATKKSGKEKNGDEAEGSDVKAKVLRTHREGIDFDELEGSVDGYNISAVDTWEKAFLLTAENDKGALINRVMVGWGRDGCPKKERLQDLLLRLHPQAKREGVPLGDKQAKALITDILAKLDQAGITPAEAPKRENVPTQAEGVDMKSLFKGLAAEVGTQITSAMKELKASEKKAPGGGGRRKRANGGGEQVSPTMARPTQVPRRDFFQGGMEDVEVTSESEGEDTEEEDRPRRRAPATAQGAAAGGLAATGSQSDRKTIVMGELMEMSKVSFDTIPQAGVTVRIKVTLENVWATQEIAVYHGNPAGNNTVNQEVTIERLSGLIMGMFTADEIEGSKGLVDELTHLYKKVMCPTKVFYEVLKSHGLDLAARPRLVGFKIIALLALSVFKQRNAVAEALARGGPGS